jgi:hypothetical protein
MAPISRSNQSKKTASTGRQKKTPLKPKERSGSRARTTWQLITITTSILIASLGGSLPKSAGGRRVEAGWRTEETESSIALRQRRFTDHLDTLCIRRLAYLQRQIVDGNILERILLRAVSERPENPVRRLDFATFKARLHTMLENVGAHIGKQCAVQPTGWRIEKLSKIDILADDMEYLPEHGLVKALIEMIANSGISQVRHVRPVLFPSIGDLLLFSA